MRDRSGSGVTWHHVLSFILPSFSLIYLSISMHHFLYGFETMIFVVIFVVVVVVVIV